MMKRLNTQERITLAVHAAHNRKMMGTIDDDMVNEVENYLAPFLNMFELKFHLTYKYDHLSSDKREAISNKLGKVLDKLADTVEELMDGKIAIETARGPYPCHRNRG